MKKIFTIAILSLLIFTSNSFGDATVAYLSDHLVAHWSLKSTSLMSATVVADEVGDNHGTLTDGAATSADYTTFDGSNDHVAVTSTAYSVHDSDYTFAFWAKLTATGSTEYVFADLTAGGAYSYIQISSIGRLVIESDTNGDSCTTTDGQITYDTNWHHYVITVTSGTVAMYQDAVLKNVVGDINDDDLTLSAIGELAGNNFDGLLHDIRIYNEVKDQAFITQLYNSGE